MKKGDKRGFTLIELIVVIAILAVLGLLLVPQITGYIAASKKSAGGSNGRSCYSSLRIQRDSGEAGLGLVITEDVECRILPKGANVKDMTGASWTDRSKGNNAKVVYSYNAITGEVTVTP